MKSRVFLLLMVLIAASLSFVPSVKSQACTCQGHACESGTSEYGGNCGLCGTLKRDCSGCAWGGWYCWNEGVCSPGQTTCSGTRYYSCSGACQWQWAGADVDSDGVDQQCGDLICDSDAGYVDANRQCDPWTNQCSGSRYQTCSTCHWVNTGTDADADGTDVQCGDSICDADNVRVDANRNCDPGQQSCLGTPKLNTCTTCHWIVSGGTDGDVDGTDLQCGDSICDADNLRVDANRDCDPGQQSCIDTPKLNTCTTCHWVISGGTDGDADGTDRQCGDNLCDHEPQRVNATRLTSETFNCPALGPGCPACHNGHDEDCDLSYDCNDADCRAAVLQGVVSDQDSNLIDAASVKLYSESLLYLGEDISDVNGAYSFNGVCGTYTVVGSKEDYLSDTEDSIFVEALTIKDVPLTLYYSQICEPDCTYVSDSIVHSNCAGINGCTFYDARAAIVCDDAQEGWIRNYNSTHVIKCASGIPQEQVRIAATAACSKENLIKVSKVVNYQGKLVKLNVVVCG